MKLDHTFTEWIGNNLNVLRKSGTFQDLFKDIEPEKIDYDIYLTNKEMGIEVVLDDKETLCHVHLIGDYREGYKPYSGDLPFNLKFGDSPDSIKEKIPIFTFEMGGGNHVPILGKVDKWVKYTVDKKYIHLTFNDSNQLIQATLGTISQA